MMQNLRRESWYIGDLAGVPLFLHWSVLLLVLMVASGGGGVERVLLVLIALVLGIVLHELGHGLAARALGARGITITLWAFGGLCESQRDHARIGREMVIVAAGPAVSLALWLGCAFAVDWLKLQHPGLLYAGGEPTLLHHGLHVGAAVNMSLFIFNMMPIFPMDGGQLVFYATYGITRNQLLARQVGLFLAVVGALAFFCWRTELFAILQAGGSPADWAGQLGWSDVFLAVVLVWILRSAFAYLY